MSKMNSCEIIEHLCTGNMLWIAITTSLDGTHGIHNWFSWHQGLYFLLVQIVHNFMYDGKEVVVNGRSGLSAYYMS